MASKPDTQVETAPTGPMTPRFYPVRQVVKETHDCFSLVVDVPAYEGFNTQPGQFNMIYAFGIGEIPVSVSSAPSNGEPLTHTVRSVGTVTEALGRFAVGDELGIRGPFGRGWPLDRAEGRDVVVVAGGIGLSPLRPAIYQMLADRDRYGRIAVVFGTRTPDDILHQKDLEAWSARLDVDVSVTVDYAAGNWRGHVGVVTRLIPRLGLDPDNAIAFVCGPEIMMRFSVAELRKLGVKDEAVYLSMERNMKCAVGFCGHCQYGPHFVCRDGPVFPYPQIAPLFRKSEI